MNINTGRKGEWFEIVISDFQQQIEKIDRSAYDLPGIPSCFAIVHMQSTIPLYFIFIVLALAAEDTVDADVVNMNVCTCNLFFTVSRG